MSKNSGAAAFMRNSYQLYKEDLTRECNKKFRKKMERRKYIKLISTMKKLT